MRTGKFTGLWFVLLMLGTTSCFKDYFEVDKLSTNIQWEPNMAVAGVNTSLTVRDVLRDYDTTHLFVEDQTGFLYLMYNKRIFSLPAKDIVTIPDITIPASSFTAAEFTGQGFPVPTTTALVTHNLTAILAMVHSELFDSMKVKHCDLTIEFNTTFQHNGILTITLPSARLNGVAYSRNIPVSAGQSIDTIRYDLAGYTIDMTSSVNQFPVLATYTLTSSGNPVNVSDQATLNLSFINLQYDYIYGDMGNYTINLNPDTVHIDIFDKAFEGNLYFVDPKFRLRMTNSFGVSMAIGLSDFMIYSVESNNYIPHLFPAQYNPFIINASQYPSPYAVSLLQLDTTNFPQIRTIVSESPKYVFFSAVGVTTPALPGQTQFISDSSRFSVDLEVELPMWGHASLFAMQDTVEFDFMESIKDSGNFTLDNIEYVMFKLITENRMPTDAWVQVYFTDTLKDIFGNFIVYDSLFYTPTNAQILQSGVLNAAGRVIGATHKSTEIKFDNPRLQKMRPVKQLLIRGTLKTTNNSTQNIRMYSDYDIRVKMGLRVQASVNAHQFD